MPNERGMTMRSIGMSAILSPAVSATAGRRRLLALFPL
ncbi:hypothetical protein NY78_3590 [Desulfovibrio sp. TomC]|nr:hypothetical protein NY78_3590 [Desulfovibrio sp. TomC]